MDNRRVIPGYKVYVERDGNRPEVYVAFLDIRDDAGATVNGTCREVEPETLAALDRRERSYHRTDVTAGIAHAPGRVWAYVGGAPGRERLAQGRATGTAIVVRSYLRAVETGFEGLGALEEFRLTTEPCDLPVRDLRRVDT
jgi:gamma-glutamylcyclotransferase (GGCT)/AIG2-like uncharacterized protein YtfP